MDTSNPPVRVIVLLGTKITGGHLPGGIPVLPRAPRVTVLHPTPLPSPALRRSCRRMARHAVALGLLVALATLIAVLKVIDSLFGELRLHVLVVVQQRLSFVVDRDLLTRVQFGVRRRDRTVIHERRYTVLMTGGGVV